MTIKHTSYFISCLAWQEVEQKLGEGSQPETRKGLVQYAERSPDPSMKSQYIPFLLFIGSLRSNVSFLEDLSTERNAI